MFSLHAGDMKFNIQDEERIGIQILVLYLYKFKCVFLCTSCGINYRKIMVTGKVYEKSTSQHRLGRRYFLARNLFTECVLCFHILHISFHNCLDGLFRLFQGKV
jgi:hypothetical protein